MSPSECREPSYQVIVQGELRPPVLAFCAGPRAQYETSGAFRLRVRDDQGIAELAARLQGAGLMILSIRRVTPTDVVVPAGV